MIARPAIALIGPDGAGKTTIGRMIEQSGTVPCRYLYMGVSAASSNIVLPTTKAAELLKRRAQRNGNDARAHARTEESGQRKGSVRAAARLANRLLEAWFRQLVSWYYRVRGYAVVYDRHFAFDFADEIAATGAEPVARRIYRWCVTRAYPRPDIVIFLDAPGEILFARKRELSVEELERRRQAFLRQGARMERFVRVDATRPLADVYDEVSRHIAAVCGGTR